MAQILKDILLEYTRSNIAKGLACFIVGIIILWIKTKIRNLIDNSYI